LDHELGDLGEIDLVSLKLLSKRKLMELISLSSSKDLATPTKESHSRTKATSATKKATKTQKGISHGGSRSPDVQISKTTVVKV
jgi:hypothetical protein